VDYRERDVEGDQRQVLLRWEGLDYTSAMTPPGIHWLPDLPLIIGSEAPKWMSFRFSYFPPRLSSCTARPMQSAATSF